MCFICISLIPAVSCAKKDDLPADKLSLIRYDVLVAEDDDVKIAVYLEKRESPYREDGNPAELKPHIVIKATAVDDFDIENADMFAEVITGDKKYSSQFGFRPISFSRECHLSPQTLPDGDLSLIISLNGERRTYNLVSIIKSDIISYEDAIISARGSGRLLGRRKLRRDPRTRTRKRRRTVLVRRIYQRRTDRGVSRRRNNGRNGSIENRTVRKIIFAKNEYFVEFCR